MGVASALVMAFMVVSCGAFMLPNLHVRPGSRIGFRHGNSHGSGQGYSFGYGSGNGHGPGHGSDNGHGNSHGPGHGPGYGSGNGHGPGHGSGNGHGHGHGSGNNSHGSGHGSSLRFVKCDYWCRSSPTRFYCCDELLLPTPTQHPGECPRLVLSCARTPGQFITPCREDQQCARVDKCCYDACLNYQICKPSQPFV